MVNAQDKDVPVALKLTDGFTSATTAERTRTSGREDAVPLTAVTAAGGLFADTLPARSLVSYVIEGRGK